MSRLQNIRNKLDTKIFNAFGTDGTLETVSSNSLNKWGDDTKTYNAAVAIKIVPYNLIDYRRNYQPFGDLGEKETDAVLPYDVSFSEGDRITFDSQAYKIIEIEKFLFDSGNLAYAVRLVKEH